MVATIFFSLRLRDHAVVFNSQETAFWVTVFVVGSAASLTRSVADRTVDRGWVLLCRSVASGAIAFGIIGCWVGRPGVPDASSPFYYVAVAALLGALQKDLQEYLVKRFVYKVFNIPGTPDAGSDDTTIDPPNPPMDSA